MSCQTFFCWCLQSAVSSRSVLSYYMAWDNIWRMHWLMGKTSRRTRWTCLWCFVALPPGSHSDIVPYEPHRQGSPWPGSWHVACVSCPLASDSLRFQAIPQMWVTAVSAVASQGADYKRISDRPHRPLIDHAVTFSVPRCPTWRPLTFGWQCAFCLCSPPCWSMRQLTLSPGNTRSSSGWGKSSGSRE